MPRRMHQARKKSTKGGRRQLAIDRELATSTRVAGNAEVLSCPADFERPIPSWDLFQHPPSLRNNITWVQGKVQAVVSISTSVPTEANYVFTANGLTNLASILGFFDQYCIYAATVSITPSLESAGSTAYTFGTCVTAIDYDNVNTLGSLSAIEAYQSAQVFEMSPGQSIQRFIKPCIAPVLYSTAGSGTFSGYGIKRSWVDSANGSVPHYGFRSYFVSNTAPGLSVTVDLAVVIGLRNNN